MDKIRALQREALKCNRLRDMHAGVRRGHGSAVSPAGHPIRNRGTQPALRCIPGAMTYSRTWFELFLRNVDPAQTEREVAFLARNLPLPAYREIADICCGLGRHSRALDALGYRVVGVDLNRATLAEARRAAADSRLVQADMGRLPLRQQDAILCMWSSFGYLDDEGNRAVLAELAGSLRPGGRLVLDLYDRDFFADRDGQRHLVRDGVAIEERRSTTEDRLRVELAYDGIVGDVFEWQVFTQQELASRARTTGLGLRMACTDFDETRSPAGQAPRMQLIFERS